MRRWLSEDSGRRAGPSGCERPLARAARGDLCGALGLRPSRSYYIIFSIYLSVCVCLFQKHRDSEKERGREKGGGGQRERLRERERERNVNTPCLGPEAGSHVSCISPNCLTSGHVARCTCYLSSAARPFPTFPSWFSHFPFTTL